MIGQTRKEALLNLGALPPNPRGLTLSGQNEWIYNECT
jgi:hypothetical protein